MSETRPPLDFTTQKAFAWAEGRWRHCPHRECRRRRRCTGGPRGTLRRSGRPLCCEPAVAAVIESLRDLRERRQRERDAPPF
ncbi:hypothetical protein CSC94_10270 [Zhengella mangrovi]|uniref:Uncharacterized protein n=1 Tax=Zhengella mangrovi TaxID=1982044 RepID=A0A2G1QPM0_9HYPH|nr:hypothetical protein [Zhengella mangrovi]PHP67411.1 hypothetical protein CSC94_10270 [Zhengella mangrovi]